MHCLFEGVSVALDGAAIVLDAEADRSDWPDRAGRRRRVSGRFLVDETFLSSGRVGAAIGVREWEVIVLGGGLSEVDVHDRNCAWGEVPYLVSPACRMK